MEDHCSYSRGTPNSGRNPEFRHCKVAMVLPSMFNTRTEAFTNQLVSAANTSAISFLLVLSQPLVSLNLILQVHDRPARTRAAHMAAVFLPTCICHLPVHCSKPYKALLGDTQQAREMKAIRMKPSKTKPLICQQSGPCSL